jgi:putative sporulation protein YtxC
MRTALKGCEFVHYTDIAVIDGDEEIIGYISNRLKKIENDKCKYVIDSKNSGGETSVICGIDSHKGRIKDQNTGGYNALMANIAVILADYIVRKYERRLINRIINTNYCYFNVVEKRKIVQSVQGILNSEDQNFISSLFKIRRRNIIIKKLIEYFRTSNKIILEGFVNFRLKEYIRDLEEVVDKAVDDFLMEREYKEFIHLLRYFVEIQEPRFELIHVKPANDGKYMLLDEKKREISGKYLKELLDEVSEGEISYDDLLVSSLITLAPKRIIVHGADNFKNKELLETIKNVFEGRMKTCSGCSTCMSCLVTVRDDK